MFLTTAFFLTKDTISVVDGNGERLEIPKGMYEMYLWDDESGILFAGSYLEYFVFWDAFGMVDITDDDMMCAVLVPSLKDIDEAIFDASKMAIMYVEGIWRHYSKEEV